MKKLFVAMVLVALTVAAYWEVKGHEFTEIDDNYYVTANARVRAGLSLANLGWALTTTHAANWHPLTWMSHMLDCQFFGLAPGPHHLVNLFWHVANTLLVFLFLARTTGTIGRSAMVAALFALHPLHVESVAWVSERKDVLSTFLFFVTLLAYAEYAETRRARWYLAALASFALGLMAKPMLVSLPLVLLILDYWPLKRVPALEASAASRCANTAAPRGTIARFSVLKRLAWEKVPFLVMAAASSVVTLAAQRKGGAMLLQDSLPFGMRMGNALVSYVKYLAKMVWPAPMAFFYPLEPVTGPQAVGAVLVLALVTVLVLHAARRHPYLLAGWLWYLVTLIPVSGVVQVGGQALADRYTYIPLTGIFVSLVWGAHYLAWRRRRQEIVLAAVAAFVLTGCYVLTRQQVMVWRNSFTLFE